MTTLDAIPRLHKNFCSALRRQSPPRIAISRLYTLSTTVVPIHRPRVRRNSRWVGFGQTPRQQRPLRHIPYIEATHSLQYAYECYLERTSLTKSHSPAVRCTTRCRPLRPESQIAHQHPRAPAPTFLRTRPLPRRRRRPLPQSRASSRASIP
jgi:hypothetical protein